MSTGPIIDQHLTHQRLFKLRSIEFELLGLLEEDEPRTMYVSADIMAVVSPPFADTEEGERLAEFRAWLDNFVEGGALSVSEDPDRKPPDTMLARVHPVDADFWSIRVTEPDLSPGIRSVGAFANLDEFVALIWDMRERIDDAFTDEVDTAMTAWRGLFGYEPPHRGATLDDYLTIFNRAV